MRTLYFLRFISSLLLWCAVPLCFGLVTRGAHSQSTEYEVKAGFVYNFLQYAEFPEIAEWKNLTLCVAAPREVLSIFRGLNAKTVGERSIVIADTSLGVGVIECRAWFGTTEFTVSSEVKSLSRRGVLTIGETSEFLEDGGMISFYLESNRVRFAVNVRTVRESGLKLSSKLLSLARIYDEKLSD